MKLNTTFQEYFDKAPEMEFIHYWNLHPQLCIGFSSIPDFRIKMRGKSITIRRLRSIIEDNPKIEKYISHIFLHNQSNRKLNIKFPFLLNNLNFVKLYALMLSEGSHKTEFRLHVPEKFFHIMFMKTLQNLFGKNIRKYIIQKTYKGIIRSSAPCAVRHLLPIFQHIPKFILKNKEFCRKYLQIVFEAEGSPIFIKAKRYVSLKRNVDVTNILKGKIKYPIGKRIYAGQIEKDYPDLAGKIKNYPPPPLLGEHLTLKKYFDIHSVIKFEALRVNKTSYRCGKISARWALYIYADSVNRFIKKINFLSKRKKSITYDMAKIKGYRRQYFALEILKKIQKKNIINASDFVKEMKKYDYVSPRTYLWRYKKSKILRKIGYGKYELLVN